MKVIVAEIARATVACFAATLSVALLVCVFHACRRRFAAAMRYFVCQWHGDSLWKQPNNPDTDHDGMNDAFELLVLETNPVCADALGEWLAQEVSPGINPPPYSQHLWIP